MAERMALFNVSACACTARLEKRHGLPCRRPCGPVGCPGIEKAQNNVIYRKHVAVKRPQSRGLDTGGWRAAAAGLAGRELWREVVHASILSPLPMPALFRKHLSCP